MRGMFSGATAFNQAIGNWNTGRVTNMLDMFNGATAFAQVINTWTASPSCSNFATGATAWITAYGNINANPPLSASLVAAGCGL